jgi:hypothetical protein
MAVALDFTAACVAGVGTAARSVAFMPAAAILVRVFLAALDTPE